MLQLLPGASRDPIHPSCVQRPRHPRSRNRDDSSSRDIVRRRSTLGSTCLHRTTFSRRRLRLKGVRGRGFLCGECRWILLAGSPRPWLRMHFWFSDREPKRRERPFRGSRRCGSERVACDLRETEFRGRGTAVYWGSVHLEIPKTRRCQVCGSGWALPGRAVQEKRKSPCSDPENVR